MAQVGKIEKVEAVIKRLHTAKGECAKGMAAGLVAAGLLLQKLSQAVVPVDTGALKNSAFTRVEGEGFSTVVTVGYTMEYAIYVHENLYARHKPGKIAKYLSKPAKDNAPQLVVLIRRVARMKKWKGGK